MDEPRAADVHATVKTTCLAIERKSFEELLGPLRSVMDANMQNRVIESVPLLSALSEEIRSEVLEQMTVETFKGDEAIVVQGEASNDKMYIIRKPVGF